ncbi:MAG: sigma 54-interacting transcriptional regulator [Acidobacteriota bacterium]
MPSVSLWCRFQGNQSDDLRKSFMAALASAGLRVSECVGETPRGAGVILFDAVTPALCDLIREASRHGVGRVLAIAASHSTLGREAVWRLMQSGASDVLAWDRMEDAAAMAARFERWRAIDEMLDLPIVRNNLVGQSHAWIHTLRQIVEVAHFTDASVIITGESGTGKELAARLIHTLDTRRDKRNLVVLDCTTIVPELSGSEFFGHERGAFTGAVAVRDGAFALADGGTLFLDEVGELPLTLQAELLRVVQERTYKRVGSNVWRETNFRLVCATNRNLIEEEARGQFRRDFYHRIATWTCHLPPLSERVEDIIPLANHFLAKLLPNQPPPELDDAVREYLIGRPYPGNVRELKQLVTRIAHHHVGPGPITVGDIPEAERPKSSLDLGNWCDGSFDQTIHRALLLGAGLKEIGRAAEDAAERLAIEGAEGNLQRAAQMLGVTDRALQMRRAARRQSVDSPDN